MSRSILVTGGAGFIGSALVRHLIENTPARVTVVDKLTYAGNLEALDGVSGDRRYRFERLDICDRPALERLFRDVRPDALVHLAAETHVDRSIDGPAAFIRTNIEGTFTLLEVARTFWQELDERGRRDFRFHHVSTDEVYGELEENDASFSETSPYAPNSPYSASKAGSDHLVRAWHRTYGLPVLITNCSNNYGPYQFPEKLIPLMILNALEGKPLPVYGAGDQIRDWLHVEDHAEALHKVLAEADIGSSYNIGGRNQIRNIDVVCSICGLLEELAPKKPAGVWRYAELIAHVADRPGHDRRYAIDGSRIERDLGWTPRRTFESGLRATVRWYLDNRDWCRRVEDGSYRRERLGMASRQERPAVAADLG